MTQPNFAYKRDLNDRLNVRRNHERHIYVVEFASGIVKVGQTFNPQSRLRNHADAAQAHNDHVSRTWFSEPQVEFIENEQALISFCAARWEPAVGAEHYQAADFDQIVEYAQGLPCRRMTDAEVAAIEARGKRAYDDLMGEYYVGKRLAELKAETDRAQTQLRMVISLVNNENRQAATDAIFETVKQLYSLVPPPWATTDPTATVRYLMGYGASAELAQRNAAEFELSMRTFYALSLREEPESFEDLARFSAPYMARPEVDDADLFGGSYN